MASTSSRVDNLADSREETPHFFKIILADTLQDRKLGIPRNFSRKYENSLADLVFLKVPSGMVWRIGLTKCDDQVWLQNGWQEFAQHFCLDYGHLLIFRYEGNSNFSVLIFDRSACEIEYASSSTFCENPIVDGKFALPKIEETEDDISFENLEDSSSSLKRKKKMLSCNMSHKRIQTRSSLQTSPKSFRSEGVDFQAQKNNGRRNHTTYQLSEGPEKFLSMVAFSKATSFKSKSPSFRVIMQKSYVKPGYTLNIPINFAKGYLKKEKGCADLVVSEGRKWRVRYKIDLPSKQPRAVFAYGWKAFVLDNNLEVGDVCVFELIKGSEIALKVVNFRVIEDEKHCLRKFKLLPAKETASGQVTQRPSHPSINLEYPSFTVVMRPYSLQHSVLCVSRTFARKYLKKQAMNVTLQAVHKTWSVYCSNYKDGTCKFYCGWPTFAEQNNLFKLIKRDDLVLQVSISRCTA